MSVTSCATVVAMVSSVCRLLDGVRPERDALAVLSALVMLEKRGVRVSCDAVPSEADVSANSC